MSTNEEYLDEHVTAAVYKTEITAVGIRHADCATPLYPQMLALISPTSGGRSVGIVRSRTKTMKLTCYKMVGLFCYLTTSTKVTLKWRGEKNTYI
jgi:hypothetical protein